jgi:hypothetical protein
MNSSTFTLTFTAEACAAPRAPTESEWWEQRPGGGIGQCGTLVVAIQRVS